MPCMAVPRHYAPMWEWHFEKSCRFFSPCFTSITNHLPCPSRWEFCCSCCCWCLRASFFIWIKEEEQNNFIGLNETFSSFQNSLQISNQLIQTTYIHAHITVGSVYFLSLNISVSTSYLHAKFTPNIVLLWGQELNVYVWKWPFSYGCRKQRMKNVYSLVPRIFVICTTTQGGERNLYCRTICILHLRTWQTTYLCSLVLKPDLDNSHTESCFSC